MGWLMVFRHRFRRRARPHARRIAKATEELTKARRRIRRLGWLYRFRRIPALRFRQQLRQVAHKVAQARKEIRKERAELAKTVAKTLIEAQRPMILERSIVAFLRANRMPVDTKLVKQTVKSIIGARWKKRPRTIRLPNGRMFKVIDTPYTYYVGYLIDEFVERRWITPDQAMRALAVLYGLPRHALLARRYVPIPSEIKVFADQLTDLYATPPFLEGVTGRELEELLE